MTDTTATETDTPDTQAPDEAETKPAQAPSMTLRVTPETQGLIDGMTDRLGFWSSQTEAALFLASLSLAQGKDPVPDDEIDGDLVDIGTLDEALEAGGQAGQLTLLGLIRDPEASLDEILDEDLTGLIEAGAAIARPRIAGEDVATATGELVDLLQAAG